MNALTNLLLSSAVVIGHAKENNHNLRGDINNKNFHPDDITTMEQRELSDTCVSRSTYLGCYENRNNNRALPHEIDGRGHTAEDCEKTCADEGFLYFAREWRGQVCSIYTTMLLLVMRFLFHAMLTHSLSSYCFASISDLSSSLFSWSS